MNVREALARVLHEAGSAPVRTELRPAEVAERARRRRRVAFAWRSLSAAGVAVLVVAALLFVPGIGDVQNPLYQPRPLGLFNGTEESPSPQGQGTPGEPDQPPDPGTQRSPDRDRQPETPRAQPGAPGQPTQPAQPDRPPDGPDSPALPDKVPDTPVSPPQPDRPPGLTPPGVPTAPESLPGDRDGGADTPTQPPDQQGGSDSSAEQDGMSVMGMRACDPVQVGGTTYNVVVGAGELPCGEARTVIRQALSPDEEASGWTCQANPAQDGIRCSSGENRVLAGRTG